MSDDRPSDREIERTLGYPTSGPPDPSAGLREHMARSPRRPLNANLGFPYATPTAAMPVAAPPQPAPQALQMLDVRSADGTIVKSYKPEDDDLALAQAKQLGGCITVAEIVADFRR